MRLEVKYLKNTLTKINMAIEKSKINPKAGWIELLSCNDYIIAKVSNYDYSLVANIKCIANSSSDTQIHATVTADSFIPLVSKLDDGFIDIYCNTNCLILETSTSKYTLPMIKELGKVKQLDVLNINKTNCMSAKASGSDIASIAKVNAKGLIDSLFAKEIQQFIYFDYMGAITFTENIYVNNFNVDLDEPTPFKVLLNATQAKLLDIFSDIDLVNIYVELPVGYDFNYNISFESEDIKLILITQTAEKTDKFPSIKLRQLSEVVLESRVVINKKDLDRALARLMVFDKKFDITVMNYSKLVFKENYVELVSIKNNNFEKIDYLSSTNVVEHESMIRFADLVAQLKAVQTKEVNISFGSKSAIAISSGNIIQLIPEIKAGDL